MLLEETFDIVVLSVGMETPKELVELAGVLDIELNEDNFAKTSCLHACKNLKGWYLCLRCFPGTKGYSLLGDGSKCRCMLG